MVTGSKCESVFTFLFLTVVKVNHLQMRHRQRHHLPQRQAVGEDVGLVADLSSFLQSLLRLPRLGADVLGLRIRH